VYEMGRAHKTDPCKITKCPRYNNGKRCKGCYDVNGSSRKYYDNEEEFMNDYLEQDEGTQWPE